MGEVLDKYLRKTPEQRKPPEQPPPARPTASTVGASAAPKPKETYEYTAYSAPAEHQPHFLCILRRRHGHLAPSYDRLDEIDFDPGGTWILLVYSHQVINLKGRNLFELAQLMLDKKVEWVCQFDGARNKMLEGDSAIITEVETYIPRARNDKARENEPSGDGKDYFQE